VSDDDATELVPTIRLTRRDRRVERDRRQPSRLPLGWFAYSVVVLVITGVASLLATNAGR
jgi:hypothetical protein